LVDNMEFEFNNANFTMLYTEREGLPVSLIESCKYGVPIICNDVGGNLEIVEHGVNGYVVNTYNELIETQDVHCEAEVMESEDPLFLLYTSGSTGKPKGVQHNQAGYILWAQMTMEWVFDVKEKTLTGVRQISVGLQGILTSCMVRLLWEQLP